MYYLIVLKARSLRAVGEGSGLQETIDLTPDLLVPLSGGYKLGAKKSTGTRNI